MMAWLVYTRGLRAPSPRVIYAVDQAGNPVLSEVERGDGVVLAKHRLTDDELALLATKQLRLADLVRRYPPPGGRDGGAPDPAPKTPAPIAPKPAGDARQLEVA